MYQLIQKSSKIRQTGTSTITIAAPGAGKRNCLTHLSGETDGAATLTVKSGSTTVFQLGLTADENIDLNWPDTDPLYTNDNESMVIDISAGNQTLNCIGFVTP